MKTLVLVTAVIFLMGSAMISMSFAGQVVVPQVTEPARLRRIPFFLRLGRTHLLKLLRLLYAMRVRLPEVRHNYPDPFRQEGRLRVRFQAAAPFPTVPLRPRPGWSIPVRVFPAVAAAGAAAVPLQPINRPEIPVDTRQLPCVTW